MGRRPTLAVVGATGAVGTVMLEILSTRTDVWGEIRLIASARSTGRRLTVRGEEVAVVALRAEAFDGVDVAMFDVPDEVSASGARSRRRAARSWWTTPGAFRMDADVPLVVPEVNPAAARQRPRGHHRQPELHHAVDDRRGRRAARLRADKLVVASYQAASGAGQSGIDTLRTS